MLRKRYIICLTINDGVLFRTKSFVPDYRYTANFVDAWSIDEIVLLDITRPGEGRRENLFEVVKEFAKRAFVPLAVGGGIRTIDDVRELLSLGADKVVVNSQALRDPDFITRIAALYGSQCVVVSIDATKRPDGNYEVMSEFGTKGTGLSPAQWAKTAQEKGAGEIFLTSIERDGSLEGFDNELSAQVSAAVQIPVIISGGAGKWQDLVDGFQGGHASAVSTSCIYHFTESSIRSAKSYLKNRGILVR